MTARFLLNFYISYKLSSNLFTEETIIEDTTITNE